MTQFDDYQKETRRTAGKDSLEILALGLAGEAGEVADAVKKIIGHGHPLDSVKLVRELGDCLWYVARLADVLGYSLTRVAEVNVEKLRIRYPDGFSTASSLNRKTEDQ